MSLKLHNGHIPATMADEDEDVSILPGAQPAEIDLDDETQDFRFLDKLTYVSAVSECGTK